MAAQNLDEAALHCLLSSSTSIPIVTLAIITKVTIILTISVSAGVALAFVSILAGVTVTVVVYFEKNPWL